MRLGCVVVSGFGLLPPGRALPQLLGIIVDGVLVWRIRYLLCSQLADSEGVVSIDGVVLDAGLVSTVLLPDVHQVIHSSSFLLIIKPLLLLCLLDTLFERKAIQVVKIV